MAGSVPPDRAERVITRDLGLALPLTVGALRTRAAKSLGEERVVQSWRFVKAAHLTSRYRELANLAAATVGTDALGLGWWDRPVTSAYPRDWHPFSEDFRAIGDVESAEDPRVPVTPAQVLAGRFAYGPVRPWSGSAFGTLASAVADEVAGAAVDFVDLNWPGAHRIEFPPGVGAGERVVRAYDAGGRISGTTFIDDDGTQYARVDLDSTWHSVPANVDWAVAVTWQGTMLRLPDEHPGADTDPWSGLLGEQDRVVAHALQRWGVSHGVPARWCAPAWTTREQVAEAWVEARAEFGPDAIRWPDASGAARLTFQQLTAAILDGTDVRDHYRRELGLAP